MAERHLNLPVLVLVLVTVRDRPSSVAKEPAWPEQELPLRPIPRREDLGPRPFAEHHLRRRASKLQHEAPRVPSAGRCAHRRSRAWPRDSHPPARAERKFRFQVLVFSYFEPENSTLYPISQVLSLTVGLLVGRPGPRRPSSSTIVVRRVVGCLSLCGRSGASWQTGCGLAQAAGRSTRSSPRGPRRP